MFFSAGFWYFLSVIFCLIIHEIGHTIIIIKLKKRGYKIHRYKYIALICQEGIYKINRIKIFLSGIIPSAICMFLFSILITKHYHFYNYHPDYIVAISQLPILAYSIIDIPLLFKSYKS